MHKTDSIIKEGISHHQSPPNSEKYKYTNLVNPSIKTLITASKTALIDRSKKLKIITV